MQIRGRDDAIQAKSTTKSKLRVFEKRIYDLKECSLMEFIQFLLKERIKLVYTPESALIGAAIKGIINQEKTVNLLEVLPIMGETLGSNFQFRKKARRTKSSTSYPQRFHGRVYVFDNEIVIIIETETDPRDIESSLIHLAEGKGYLPGFEVEHRVIRLKRKIR